MQNIVKSLVVIVALVSVAGGATYSYFSDTSASSVNTFSSGTLTLGLANGTGGSFTDNVTASFGGTNLFPGGVLPSQVLQIKNTGSIDGDHLNLTVTLPSNMSVELAKNINIDHLYFGNTTKQEDLIAILLGTPNANKGHYDVSNIHIGHVDTEGAIVENGVVTQATSSGNGKVSLYELAQIGAVRIEKTAVGASADGINTQTSVDLKLNASVSEALTAQNVSTSALLTWEILQDASQPAAIVQ
jgi:predicted ribosomally synthesized peptide with SipW-like signal peptide